MNTRVLKLLAVFLPVVFFGTVIFGRAWLVEKQIIWEVELPIILIVMVGAVAFSNWIFQIINQREEEIRNRSAQLTALHEASLALTTELELNAVLQKVVDLAAELVKSRYGALGVLDENGERIERFLVYGLTREQYAKIGAPPEGRGLLGVLFREGRSMRVMDIENDSRSVGLPLNHPPMHSLLGVPIKSKGKIIGDLYLTDKIDNAGGEYAQFTLRDQQTLEMFATQAAIAIENAKFYRQTQQLAILEERERFGMDLHDGIIQHIYAIGLMLEDTQHRLWENLEGAEEGITNAISGLNEVIRDIRNYILDLRPQRFQGRDLVQGLDELARELRANSFLNVNLHVNGAKPLGLSPESTVEILHIGQEALTNIRKHARASCVDILLNVKDDSIILEIEDDGVGFISAGGARSSGNGLYNMQERARAIEGKLEIVPAEETGTCIRLHIPL